MEATLVALLAFGSGIAGLVTGGQLGFAGGSLLGSLLVTVNLVDVGVRQGILTLEQADALGQQIGRQIGESFPTVKDILRTWQVTVDVPGDEPVNGIEESGANRFVQGIVRELQRSYQM
jgi:hypothetical protein